MSNFFEVESAENYKQKSLYTQLLEVSHSM